MRRRRARKPIDRLIENMNLLTEIIENPLKYGSFILIYKVKGNKDKPPTSIELLKFKINMEFEIRRISRKIEKKLGWELPSGLK